MNVSRKSCKLCPKPAQMTLTMQVTTCGSSKRRRVSAKAVPLCFACGALWGVALSQRVAIPYCEAINELEPSANASVSVSEMSLNSEIDLATARRVVNIAAARARWSKYRKEKSREA